MTWNGDYVGVQYGRKEGGRMYMTRGWMIVITLANGWHNHTIIILFIRYREYLHGLGGLFHPDVIR